MRRLIKFALCLLIVGLSFSHVDALSCDQIAINVYLQDNGDAYIEEKWTMDIERGTEVYKDESALNDCEILDFSVEDDQGNHYENIGEWKENASFDQKAYRCGINTTANGIELCWGISNYGSREYTLKYTMTNFIQGYSDYVGFNQRLVNDQMSEAPQVVRISIYSDVSLNDQNTSYWGFGFDGDLTLYEDGLEVISNRAFDSSNHATIMMRFDSNLFHPTLVHDYSFSELENQALEGTHILPTWLIALIIVLGIALVGLVIYLINFFWSAKKVHFPKIKKDQLDYYRDIPYDHQLLLSYYVLKESDQIDQDTNIISCYLLKWLLQENIYIKDYSKKHTAIYFNHQEHIEDPLELELYQILLGASKQDGILIDRDFEKWSRNHYDKLEEVLNEFYEQGKSFFEQAHYSYSKMKKGLFGLIKTNQKQLNDEGLKEYTQLLGFKKYLKDYTLIDERTPLDVYTWQDYLIYASLFGIAKEVSEQLNRLYPEYFNESFGFYDDPYYTYMLFMHMDKCMYEGYHDGYESSHSSSTGGGGGFSGGGSGGGVR